MHNEFTAIIERDGKWFVAYCPEIPGANGQGKTKQECLKSVRDAIDLIHAEIPNNLARKICRDLSVPEMD